MLWNLPFLWLTMAVAAVVILSFIVSTALDALIRDEAFGATGNTVVMAFGFFAAIYLANIMGHRLSDLGRALPVGVGGAFTALSFLIALKGTMRRLFG